MSKFLADWVETNKYGDKVISVKEGERTVDYTISPTDKKGREFPNFSSIAPGSVIEGNAWQSPKGKWYIFAPDPDKNPNGTYKPTPNPIKAAQERKEASIFKAQDRKEESIAYFNSVNAAINLMSHIDELAWNDENAVKETLVFWRNFFYEQWLQFDPTKEVKPF